MSDPDKPSPDDDFERDLAALSRAYGTARREEPPPAVDDAIRAAARRAVHAGPQPRRFPRVSHWATPVATAAVVMLTVSIGLVSWRERPDLASTEVRSDMPSRTQAPAAAPPSSSAAAPAASPAQDSSLPTPAAPAPIPLNETAPVTGKLRAEAPAASGEVPRARATEANVKGNFVAPPEPAAAALQAAPAPAPATSTASPMPAARDTLPLEKRSVATPAAAPPAPPAAPGNAAPARQEMPSADRAAPAAASGAVAQRAKVEKADRTPEAWLKEIGELKREGKLKEALAELETFRKRFPDYVLPPELKELR
jgi:hypothetical protein